MKPVYVESCEEHIVFTCSLYPKQAKLYSMFLLRLFVFQVIVVCVTLFTACSSQTTPSNPSPELPPTQAAKLLLAQQNNAQETSPLALSFPERKTAINTATFYDGITVYLYMNDYSMSNKLLSPDDTFSTDDFKYGPKGTASSSEGLSLLNGITKDIYFWVSGNVPGDLYDDATWARVTDNFKALAQAANDLNQQGDYSFKGIFFDDESSKVGNFFPFDCEVYGAYDVGETCETRQLKMRERGKQIMMAMLSVWPDLTWVQLHTPAVSMPGYDDTPLGSDPTKTMGGDFDFEHEDYELAGPFFAGLAEAVLEAKTGSVVSGGNIYKLRNKVDFQDHEIFVDGMGTQNLAWLPASLRGKAWQTTVKAGFGVYNKDFPPLPSFAYQDLAVPAEKLKNARCVANELVFLYIEPDEGSGRGNWYTNMPSSWQSLVQASSRCE
jgi:hypothetical protein